MITQTQPTTDSLLPFAASGHDHRNDSQKPSTITEEEHRANEEFLAGAYAPNTAMAYRSQLRAWVNWCAQRGLSPRGADADALVTYIRERAEGVAIGDRYHWPAKPNSLNVACAAISKAYGVAELPDITKHARVREALRSHRYRMARAGVRVRQAEALTAENMAAIRATALLPRRGRGGMETGEQARRRGLADIALVGLMRDCMLRRSEAADVRWGPYHLTPGWHRTTPRGGIEDRPGGRGRAAVRQQAGDAGPRRPQARWRRGAAGVRPSPEINRKAHCGRSPRRGGGPEPTAATAPALAWRGTSRGPARSCPRS